MSRIDIVKILVHHYKPYYYYSGMIRNDTTYRVSVCVLYNGEIFVSRGLAICSQSDQFDRKKGRSLATLRAICAVAEQKNSSPVLRERLRYDEGTLWKCRYMPVMNDRETKLLERIKMVRRSFEISSLERTGDDQPVTVVTFQCTKCQQFKQVVLKGTIRHK